MWYENLIGKEQTVKYFQNAFDNNRLGHAYIFQGPKGVGKKEFALRLSQAILCDKGLGYGCGHCPTCSRVLNLTHPDLLVIEPIEQNKTIRIRQIRELISLLSRRIHQGRKRIVIINPFDILGDEAANAFLKTLEEPPEDTMFFLLSSDLGSIRPTIVSRCQIIDFRPLTENEMKGLLSKEQIDGNLLTAIIILAAGSQEEALKYARDEEVKKSLEAIIAWFFQEESWNLEDRIKWLDAREDEKWSAEDFHRFWLVWQSLYRDRLLLSLGSSMEILNFPHLVNRYKALAERSPLQINQRLLDCQKAIRLLSFVINRNPQVLAEAILMNWSSEF